MINPEGGSANFSVNIPEVDKMIDSLVLEQDEAKRGRDLGRPSTSE